MQRAPCRKVQCIITASQHARKDRSRKLPDLCERLPPLEPRAHQSSVKGLTKRHRPSLGRREFMLTHARLAIALAFSLSTAVTFAQQAAAPPQLENGAI